MLINLPDNNKSFVYALEEALNFINYLIDNRKNKNYMRAYSEIELLNSILHHFTFCTNSTTALKSFLDGRGWYLIEAGYIIEPLKVIELDDGYKLIISDDVQLIILREKIRIPYVDNNGTTIFRDYHYEFSEQKIFQEFFSYLKQIQKQNDESNEKVSGHPEDRKVADKGPGIQMQGNPIAVATRPFRNPAAVAGGGGKAKLLRIWGELVYPRVCGAALQG